MDLIPTTSTETPIDWEARAISAETQIGYLRNQIDDLQLNLEIANERWVKAVNEQAETEVQLRKLKRQTNPM